MDFETHASPAGAPPAEEFRRLLRRFLVLASQLRLASKDFGDLSGLPHDHVAAALVVQDASAALAVLHDDLCDWYAGQSNTPGGPPKVSLVLREYVPDRKVSVIRVLREVVPGYSLTAAKALVERELPTPIADGLAPEQAELIRQKFAAVGAICSSCNNDAVPTPAIGLIVR